jgi:hypothetical protein
MAETKTTGELSGIEITTGQDYWKGVRESIPVAGGAFKTFDAAKTGFEDGKLAPDELGQIQSEGSAFIQSCTGAATGIAMDPIGWLVGQGLSFLISICQPLQDAIHFVSGDGPALEQAAGNFANIGKGLEKMKAQFEEDLKSSLQSWGGDASEAAGTKLGEFASGIDGVAGQAGDIAQLLQTSSMVMTVIEDFIKALLTELITWLIMIWIPALAAAIPTAGASTAAAGTATTVKGVATGSKVTRMIAKLRKLLDDFMAFLRSLKTRMGSLRTGFKQAMDNKRMRSGLADLELQGVSKSSFAKPLEKLHGKDGLIGGRVQDGFGKSMLGQVSDTAAAQVGAGTGANAGPEKLLRNVGNTQKAGEYDETSTDYSKEETEGYLDI